MLARSPQAPDGALDECDSERARIGVTAKPRLQLSCRGWRTTASTRRCTSGSVDPAATAALLLLYGIGRCLVPGAIVRARPCG